MSDQLEKKIDDMDWTLYDRLMYGGLGHGYFCMPTNLVRVVATVLFPPIAIILKYLHLSTEFPYITIDTLVYLFKNIDDIVYSFVLTALFYIPGLIYGLTNLKCSQTSDPTVDTEALEDVTMNDIKEHFKEIKTMKKIRAKQR